MVNVSHMSMGSAREAREYPEPTCVAYVRAHVRADQYERATEAYPRLSDEKTPAFNLARCCGKSLPYFASFGDYTNCKLASPDHLQSNQQYAI